MKKYDTVTEYIENEFTIGELYEIYNVYKRLDKNGSFSDSDKYALWMYMTPCLEYFNISTNIDWFRKYTMDYFLDRLIEKLDSIRESASL